MSHSSQKDKTESELFEESVSKNIASLKSDSMLASDSIRWIQSTLPHRYSYNFKWLGRPIIQYPQDMVAIQELIWNIRPTLIIETGIAHGGSLILSASMLALMNYCDALEAGEMLDPKKSRRTVLGIDIDIRPHNRSAIEAHPLSHHIQMIQGSSTAPEVIEEVRKRAADHERVMVILDSNHTHEHVIAELEAYAPLVTADSYCVVFDTVIEDLAAGIYPDRDWDVGNNPKTAVHEFLLRHTEFEIDKNIDAKLLISVAPDGYLRRR